MCHFIILVTCEEYDLLLRLNQITIAKYSDMGKLAGGLTDVSKRLNEKCKFVSNPSTLSNKLEDIR